MKEILIITGACGVGKTTTSRAWAKRKAGAVIECDYFTEWIYHPDFPRFSEADERFVANLSCKIAQEYLDWGMSVVIENVWTPLGLEILNSNVKQKQTLGIKTVWLKCEIQENHRRDEQRIPENQMKERVDIVNGELAGYSWPLYVHEIDSTHLTVEQILDIIDDLPYG